MFKQITVGKVQSTKTERLRWRILADCGYGAPEHIILFNSNPINHSAAVEPSLSPSWQALSFPYKQERGEKKELSLLYERGNGYRSNVYPGNGGKC